MDLNEKAEKDEGMQKDLLAACAESPLFFVNTFCMTFHQFDVNPVTGKRFEAKHPHEPMITWPIQDDLMLSFVDCVDKGEDVLIDKARDMGASWLCVDFMDWLMLFRPNAQLLEMSRNEDYVDKAENMKALFQKHDYLHSWYPEWMCPPDCFLGQANRTHMHWFNPVMNTTLDGESTTKHAARGDRRLVALLDEFGAVQNGAAMRGASRDAALVRIVNSTSVPGSEYNKWRSDKTIKVFVMPYWEHPEKGAGRYVNQTKSGKYEIRSPWFDAELPVRGMKYMSTEVLREDTEPGLSFFTIENIENHAALYARPPKTRWDIKFRTFLGYEETAYAVRNRQMVNIVSRETSDGPLKLWCDLVEGRPDQTKNYIFGIDTGKGQGASNSVISIKCRETGEKVGEWADANYPPYEFASIIVAIAMWFGGQKPHRLPFLKWEKNGPGWDLGRILVKKYYYPHYYRHIVPGKITDRKTQDYGRHTSQQSKYELLSEYDRVLAYGKYVNRSKEALDEARDYIHYPSGGVGPANLRQESSSAKKTHGDRVIADALTLDDSDVPKVKVLDKKIHENSVEFRFRQFRKNAADDAKKYRHKKKFNFTLVN